jgi:hypothetical protein
MAEWSRLSSDCALFLAKAWRHGAAERQTDAMDRDISAASPVLPHVRALLELGSYEQNMSLFHNGYRPIADVLHRNFRNYVTYHARLVVMVTVPHAKLTYACRHDELAWTRTPPCSSKMHYLGGGDRTNDFYDVTWRLAETEWRRQLDWFPSVYGSERLLPDPYPLTNHDHILSSQCITSATGDADEQLLGCCSRVTCELGRNVTPQDVSIPVDICFCYGGRANVFESESWSAVSRREGG